MKVASSSRRRLTTSGKLPSIRTARSRHWLTCTNAGQRSREMSGIEVAVFGVTIAAALCQEPAGILHRTEMPAGVVYGLFPAILTQRLPGIGQANVPQNFARRATLDMVVGFRVCWKLKK